MIVSRETERMMDMKKSFIERVIKEHVVDTRKYRYIYEKYSDKAVIKRASIEWMFYPWLEGYEFLKWQIVKEWY